MVTIFCRRGSRDNGCARGDFVAPSPCAPPFVMCSLPSLLTNLFTIDRCLTTSSRLQLRETARKPFTSIFRDFTHFSGATAAGTTPDLLQWWGWPLLFFCLSNRGPRATGDRSFPPRSTQADLCSHLGCDVAALAAPSSARFSSILWLTEPLSSRQTMSETYGAISFLLLSSKSLLQRFASSGQRAALARSFPSLLSTLGLPLSPTMPLGGFLAGIHYSRKFTGH
jgi:hypothetical protein